MNYSEVKTVVPRTPLGKWF